MVLMKDEMSERPMYIYMSWGSRTVYNKFLYSIYKILQLLYTSFFYYFMPFIASIVVWYILLQENYDQAKTVYDLE